MTGTIEQAIDRLAFALKDEEDRKVVFLTGSGISMPQVPSTGDMVTFFLKELGSSAAQLDTKLTGLTPAQKYQLASHELKQRRGDRGLAAAIRKGVLKALKDDTLSGVIDAGTIRHEDWNIPSAQRLLGELISKIPPQQLGAIITTNFDSLTEVACTLNNVNVVTLAVPGTTAFPIEGLFGALPVVHLHGYWDKSATLSTTAQLQADRPDIERMISRVLDKSILVVLGYGGWDDSFTRSLTRMIRDGRLSSLETEIMWLQYEGPESIQSHSVLRKIEGSAGVNIYCEIKADEFLQGVLREVSIVNRRARKTFLGWATPPTEELPNPAKAELLNYVQGAQPSWVTASKMPVLRNTENAYQTLKDEIMSATPHMIVLAAPAGEGKSTALRQIALKASEDFPEAEILYRNAGAPQVTAEWVNFLKSENPLTLVFVDDGDLVANQIVRAREKESDQENGKVVWVVAMHTTYLHSGPIRRLLAAEDPRLVEFSSFEDTDANALAGAWLDAEILPAEYRDQTSTDIAKMIEDAAESTQGRSLFGSILHLWSGDDLVDRVSDLLTKVAGLSISGVSFKHLLSAVAVTQVAWDLEGELGDGLSLAALGELARITHQDVLRMVVEPLGREVGISQVGDRVYVRHPSIAEAIYDLLDEHDELDEVVREVSRKGATMRYSGKYSKSDSKSAYRLARRLEGPEAIAASFGAIEGAGNKLEPRVTAIATLRENEELEKASRYAHRLSEDLSPYSDKLQVVRGFYVEWSVVESRLGHLDRAVELAVTAISDQVAGFLPLDNLQYGLINILTPTSKLELVNRPGAAELNGLCAQILSRLPDPKKKFRRQSQDHERSSLLTLTRDFRRASLHFAGVGTTFVKMQAVLREHDQASS